MEGQAVEIGQIETKLNSPYFNVALGEFRKVAPEQEGVLRNILENIDQQGLDNLGQFQIPGFPETAFPYTKVSVNGLSNEMRQTNIEPDPNKKIIYMVFGGFAFPPAGHPFTPWDIVYDRAIGELSQIAGPIKRGEKPPEISVYSLGSPNGLGGKVSEQWLEAIKKNSFTEYGKAYAGFIKEMFPEAAKENTRFVFQGMSMGATNAEHTAGQLPELKAQIRLLLDNPAGDHNKLAVIWKAIKLPGGFMGEGLVRMNFDKKTKQAGQDEKVFLAKLGSRMSVSAIEEATKVQNDLKLKAALVDGFNLIKGLPKQYDDVRTYIRRGLFDPTAFDPVTLIQTIFKTNRGDGIIMDSKSKTSKFPVSQTHFINRYRVGLWAQKLGFVTS